MVVVEKGAAPAWLEAKLEWPAGCQSCVSTTWLAEPISRFTTGTISSPPPTASAPPGQKSFCMSMTMSAVASAESGMAWPSMVSG